MVAKEYRENADVVENVIAYSEPHLEISAFSELYELEYETQVSRNFLSTYADDILRRRKNHVPKADVINYTVSSE